MEKVNEPLEKAIKERQAEIDTRPKHIGRVKPYDELFIEEIYRLRAEIKRLKEDLAHAQKHG